MVTINLSRNPGEPDSLSADALAAPTRSLRCRLEVMIRRDEADEPGGFSADAVTGL